MTTTGSARVEEIDDIDDANYNSHVSDTLSDVRVGGDSTAMQSQSQQKPTFSVLDKRTRKFLEPLDLVPVPGIVRVVMRLPRNEIVVLMHPEVVRCRYSNAYFVCGAASIQRLNNQSKIEAAKSMLNRFNSGAAGAGGLGLPSTASTESNTTFAKAGSAATAASAAAAAASRNNTVGSINAVSGSADTVLDADYIGNDQDTADGSTHGFSNKNRRDIDDKQQQYVSERDISIVMEQSSVTREQAVAKLREKRGDVISAILDLTE